MIHLADAALLAWLSSIDPQIDVAIGPVPPPDRSAGHDERPALRLELLAVREQLDRRDEEVRDVRDAAGRVVERRRSTRWFELDYRCSTGGEAITAHRLLGAVLQLLVDHSAVPAEHVPLELAPSDLPIAVDIVPDDRQSALGGIVLRAVIPVRPTPERDIAAPAVELHLDVGPEPGSPGADATPLPSGAASVPLERAWTTVRRRERIAAPRPGEHVDGQAG